MGERAKSEKGGGDRTSVRALAEKLVLAAVGAVSLTGERVESLADELAQRAGIRPDEARGLIDEVTLRWKREAGRLSERTGETAAKVARDVGLATREQVEELELRLAQLEHRLKLLEKKQT